MKTHESVRLTRTGIIYLFEKRSAPVEDCSGNNRRNSSRLPCFGIVELRAGLGNGTDQWYGTSVNLSKGGLGLSIDVGFDSGLPVDIAFHLPRASFYGRAIVRHCLETPRGFRLGLEFDYDVFGQ